MVETAPATSFEVAEAEFLLRRSLREADRLPAGERTDPESEIEGDAHR